MRVFPLGVLICGMLTACAPATPNRTGAPAASQMMELNARLAELPGAEVSDQPLVVSYPGESLFASGAALPLPGGTAVLDPLAQLLAATPGVRWRGTVRAATAWGEEYDRRLAAARAELLSRYFGRRGVGGERLHLVPEAAPGAALELVPEDQPASSASSSREKR